MKFFNHCYIKKIKLFSSLILSLIPIVTFLLKYSVQFSLILFSELICLLLIYFFFIFITSFSFQPIFYSSPKIFFNFHFCTQTFPSLIFFSVLISLLNTIIFFFIFFSFLSLSFQPVANFFIQNFCPVFTSLNIN